MWRGQVDMWRRIDREIDVQLAGAGLSRAEFELLGPLSEGPEEGIRPKELGGIVGWDTSRVAHLLRRMEKRGLIERYDCDGDGRGTVVRVTVVGRQLMKDAAAGHLTLVRRLFVDQLTDHEVEVLTRISRRIRHEIDPTKPR